MLGTLTMLLPTKNITSQHDLVISVEFEPAQNFVTCVGKFSYLAQGVYVIVLIVANGFLVTLENV